MRFVLSVVVLAILTVGARADEGMWTFHDFPSAKVQARYGFSPDQAWLDKARKSSARIAGICSASFVSDSGLVMTNHHCAHECVADLSTKDHDFVKDGFWAAAQTDEKKCPNMEIQRLDDITDVTDKVTAATASKSGPAYTAALREISASIEKSCQTDTAHRCEFVNLYHGGQFMLYRYKRFTDVRVVFAPELAMAFFGGDPDNFEFPRYDLDVSFVRVYEDGKPAATPDHFGWAPAPKDGELTFISGDPAATEREITSAERVFDRDVVAPMIVATRAEWRGILAQWMRESDEQHRIGEPTQFYNENSLKAWKGRQAALGDAAQMKRHDDAEVALKAGIAGKPDLAKAVGGAFDDIAKAHAMFAPFYHRFYLLETMSHRGSDLLADAVHLVRGADERALADGKRLDEYRDSALPDIEQKLASTAPLYPAFEKLEIAFWLGKLREELGADDATVKALLGKDSPEQAAARYVDGSKLLDATERTRLWKGGRSAVAASRDPMLELVRKIDAASRKVRKTYDDDVEGVTRAAHEKIARARFALQGRTSYPDATFTLRLSYGAVSGYTSTATGQRVAPFTYMGGAFDRATGQAPFALPKTWLDARSKIDGRVPFDFVTTNDIIGGNSGSPIFDKNLNIVGLVFDGNIESLAGDFWYDDTANRAVGVSSAALLEALAHVYHADRLVTELQPKK
jgi:hypothetical protein|nr:S46 family peptidase [Kofleriaceae bacterium]